MHGIAVRGTQHSAAGSKLLGHRPVSHHGKTLDREQYAIELSIGVYGLKKKQLDKMDKEEGGQHIRITPFPLYG